MYTLGVVRSGCALTVLRSCGFFMSFKLSWGIEKRTQFLDVCEKYLPEAPPKYFIYDTADQLKMHLNKNPRPYWIHTKFLIDNFHLSGRIKRATTNSFCKSK